MTVTVDLIRHTTSTWTEQADALPRNQRTFGGRMDHVDLSVTGEREAYDLGLGGVRRGFRPTHIIVSPARRTLSTHRISARPMHTQALPVIKEPRLVELSWGDWEGQPRSIATTESVLRRRRRKGFAFRPPGGESYLDVRRRALQSLTEHVRGLPRGSHVWVHTHRNVIKAIVYHWMNWSALEILDVGPGVGSLTRLQYSNGHFSVTFYNLSML